MEVQSRTSDKSPRRPTVRASRDKQSRGDLRPLPLPLPLWGVILGILGVARPMLRTKNPVKSLNEKPQDFGRELVAPTEFEPVFQSRSRFRYLTRHVEEHLPLRNTTRLKHAACTTPMIHNHSAVKSGRGPLSAAGRAPHRRHRASISGHCRHSGHGLPQGVAHPHRTYQPRDTEHSVLHAVIRELWSPACGKPPAGATDTACPALSRRSSAGSSLAACSPTASRGCGAPTAPSSASCPSLQAARLLPELWGAPHGGACRLSRRGPAGLSVVGPWHRASVLEGVASAPTVGDAPTMTASRSKTATRAPTATTGWATLLPHSVSVKSSTPAGSSRPIGELTAERPPTVAGALATRDDHVWPTSGARDIGR